MADKKGPDVDELLARAEALKARAQHGKLEKKSSTGLSETITSVADNLSFFRRAVQNVVQGFLGFHERFLSPLWYVVSPPIKWAGRVYGRLWNRWAYHTDASSGERVISRKRAGLIVGFTILVVSIFTPTRVGDAVRFITVEPVVDGILMTFSKKTETFYLSHSEEIDPVGNEHSVRGCKHGGQCTELDAAYFRVKPRLSHDIWKLITQGNPIYVPDHVVAPIAPGVNRCEVTYYGYRMTSSWISRLMRSFEVYPVMLDAQCRYLGGSAGSSE